MLISFEKKFIFIHNYKVAGTSIKKALSDYGLVNPVFNSSNVNKRIEKSILRTLFNNSRIRKGIWKLNLPGTGNFKSHLTALEIEKKIPSEIFNSFFKFGFVRNPWDWQVSLYFYMKQTETHHQNKLSENFSTFEEYLEWRVNYDKHLQKDFYFNDQNESKVDYLGKIESLDEDFKTICEKIGLDNEIGHSNKSTRSSDYQKYYNSYTKNLVGDHFAEDIQLFNYDF